MYTASGWQAIQRKREAMKLPTPPWLQVTARLLAGVVGRPLLQKLRLHGSAA